MSTLQNTVTPKSRTSHAERGKVCVLENMGQHESIGRKKGTWCWKMAAHRRGNEPSGSDSETLGQSSRKQLDFQMAEEAGLHKPPS